MVWSAEGKSPCEQGARIVQSALIVIIAQFQNGKRRPNANLSMIAAGKVACTRARAQDAGTLNPSYSYWPESSSSRPKSDVIDAL